MSENTFTQEQVDEMIKERIAREREKSLRVRKKNWRESTERRLKSMKQESIMLILLQKRSIIKVSLNVKNNLILQIRNLQH